MHEPAPHHGDHELSHRALSRDSDPVEPDAAALRAAIEREIAQRAGTGEAAQARLLGELATLSAAQQRELIDIVRIMDDPRDALAPAIEVITPGGPLEAAAITEAFLNDDLLQRQWQYAYDTLRSI
jgi:hypothetical protein